MKNFTGFKYQKSVLRTVEEPPKKKKFNWDRFLFIIALLVIAGYFVNNMYNKVVFVSTDGLVIMDKTSIHFTEDIRIDEIYVLEGDPVDEGDTLFRYRYEDREMMNNEFKNLSLRAKINEPDNWFLHEKLNVKGRIAVKKTRRIGLESALEVKQKELEEQKKQILLGVDVAHKLPPLLSAIADAESDLKVLDKEIYALRKHLRAIRREEKKALARQKEMIEERIGEGNDLYGQDIYSTSPIGGLIGRIYKNSLEVCYESEEVMVIHQLENLKIKTYFDQAAYKEINVGDEVQIEFPDGAIGYGVIQNFYVSTYPLPPEFQKKYEPTRRSIVADVLPLNEEEAKVWARYYKMAVKVHKKYNYFLDFF